ncbi:hypothetical protein D9M68_572910 [compost metagenome]
MQAGHRHVELGFVGVLQGEEFRALAVDLQGDQAHVAADAMVDVHHRRAFAQLGEVLDDVVAGVALLLAAPALHDAVAEQRTLGDQRDAALAVVGLQQQAFVHRRDGDRQALAVFEELRPAFDFHRAQLDARQQLQQHLAAAGGFGGEQDAPVELLDELAQAGQRLGGLGLDGQFRQRLRRELLAADARFDGLGADHHARPALQAGEAVLHRQEQLGRRQQRALGIVAAVLVAVAHVAPELLGGLLDARQGEHLGVLRQVVEQGRGFLEEQRQVVLDAGRRQAAGEVLVDRAAPVVDVEALAEAVAETGHRLLAQREFPRRQQADAVDLLDGALVLRVEGAQRLDLVVEQVDPVGQLAAHREQVDQRAAHGEFAMLVDGVDAAVAGRFQAQAHLFDVELLADVQHQAAAEQELRRRQAVQGGGDGHDQNAVLQLG